MKNIIFCLIFLLMINSLHAKVIKDIEGRRVKIPEKINKIIGIGPGALRFIAYMQSTEEVCGVEQIEFKLQKNILRPYYYAVKEKIKELPIIGEGGPGKIPYFEKIMLLKPDVIIAVGFSKTEANLIQNKTMTPVVLLSYGSLGILNRKFKDSIEILGKVLNKERRASELIEYLNMLQEQLKSLTINEKNNKIKVYIGGVAYKGVHDITSTDTDFFPFKLINLENIAKFSSIKGHVFIKWEDLLLWDPDYIFIDKTSLSLVIKNYKKNQERYNILKAFKNRKVFVALPYNYYNTNVALAMISAYCIGEKVFPQAFKSIDLKEKAENILKKFLGINLELRKNFCNESFVDLLNQTGG